MRILVVEDNVRLAALIRGGLRERGFAADVASNLRRAEESFAITNYDAIVLDRGLPDGDGLDWLRLGGRALRLPPVLVLTARDSLGDRVEGLDSGADDYVTKPFELDELAARIRAMLRRPGERVEPIIKVANLTYDPSTRVAQAGDAAIELTRREADLLELLMRRVDRVVTRAAIENAIYDIGVAVTPNALEALLSRLRRKLVRAGASALPVTVRGVGYVLRSRP